MPVMEGEPLLGCAAGVPVMGGTPDMPVLGGTSVLGGTPDMIQEVTEPSQTLSESSSPSPSFKTLAGLASQSLSTDCLDTGSGRSNSFLNIYLFTHDRDMELGWIGEAQHTENSK